MKIPLLQILLFIMGCSGHVVANEPDPSKSGSHSHMLKYSISFHPGIKGKEAQFKATLVNNTDRQLMVQVNDKEFHSSLEIADSNGNTIKAFDKRYRTLLLTSTWFEPVITIAPKKSVSWKVPLSSLLTLQGKPVTHEMLSEKHVVSEMVMAVVPKAGSSVSDNAIQRSASITIPKKG